jgi:iron complex outermembrane receptor protein
VSAGIRYTKEKRDYERTTSLFSNSPLLVALNPTFPIERKDSWEDVSPMASIDYQINPATMVYARVARGFKSGGFNGRANSAADATTYDPETVTSYEAGLKTTIARQLRLNFAAFYNDYKDFQARVAGTDDSGTIPVATLGVLNAGQLKIQGAELELAWTPVQGLLLDSQIGYLDAEYGEFFDERFPIDSRAFQTPAFAPDWTIRLGAQYEANLGNTGYLTVGGQSRYRSEMALSVDNTVIIGTVGTTTKIEGLFADPYWMHDARVVWENASRMFNVGLYVQNLTDKVYKTEGQDFSSIGSIRTVYYGAPRTWFVKAGVRF